MVGKNMRDPKRILKRSFNFFRIFWNLFAVRVVKTLKKNKHYWKISWACLSNTPLTKKNERLRIFLKVVFDKHILRKKIHLFFCKNWTCQTPLYLKEELNPSS
jgi:hypothetical protein